MQQGEQTNLLQSSFANIFFERNIDVQLDQEWLIYGSPIDTSHWCIEFSCMVNECESVIRQFSLLPFVNDVKFRLIRNVGAAYRLNGGELGRGEIGRILTIYLEDTDDLKNVVDTLKNIQTRASGPSVEDSVRVHRNVYLRRVEVNQRPNGIVEIIARIPLSREIKWLKSAFSYKGKKTVFKGNGVVLSKCLHTGISGSLYLGYKLNGLSIKRCVAKIARHGTMEDWYGRTSIDRLISQKGIIECIAGRVPTAVVLDAFHDEDDFILVLEYIPSVKIAKAMSDLRLWYSWPSLPVETRLLFLSWYIQILDCVASLHSMGIIHRDLQDENFVVHKGKVYLLDFELSWRPNQSQLNPPFTLGTEGYMSIDQRNYVEPTFKDDIYSLGCLLSFFILFIHPKYTVIHEYEMIQSLLSQMLVPEYITDLILRCAYSLPQDRPSVDEIRDLVIRFMNEMQGSLAVNRFFE